MSFLTFWIHCLTSFPAFTIPVVSPFIHWYLVKDANSPLVRCAVPKGCFFVFQIKWQLPVGGSFLPSVSIAVSKGERQDWRLSSRQQLTDGSESNGDCVSKASYGQLQDKWNWKLLASQHNWRSHSLAKLCYLLISAIVLKSFWKTFKLDIGNYAIRLTMYEDNNKFLKQKTPSRRRFQPCDRSAKEPKQAQCQINVQ